ncbi:MAG: ankyrin repeat domain-containing protein, partial [Gammaproteobacteria bacterium]|nr:ankyrin repeat domain-containing protein [Gammaproteobacteria bacterium]
KHAKKHPVIFQYIIVLVDNYYLSHKKDQNGRTLLHWKLLLGELDSLKELVLYKNYPINVSDNSNQTLLHYAAAQGLEEIVPFLMAFRLLKIDARDKVGATPLFIAVKYGHEKMVDMLLLYKANASIPLLLDDSNRAFKMLDTPLHIAAMTGRKAIVESLLNHVHVNLYCLENYTALHYAAREGHVDIIELLINKKAHVNARSSVVGITPLLCAIKRKQIETVKLLLTHYADTTLNVLWNYGILTRMDAALHAAVKTGCIEIVAAILNDNANVNLLCLKNNTALHYATSLGDVNIVKLLAEKGANLNARNMEGMTPLHNAIEAGHIEIVAALLDAGADKNILNAENESPFTLALESHRDDIAKLLMEKGALVNKKDFRTKLFLSSFFYRNTQQNTQEVKPSDVPKNSPNKN